MIARRNPSICVVCFVGSRQAMALEFALVIAACLFIVTAVVTQLVGCLIWEFIENDVYSKFVPTKYAHTWLCVYARCRVGLNRFSGAA